MVTIVIETNIEDFPTIYAVGLSCSENGVFVNTAIEARFLLFEDIKSITIKKEGEK